MRNLSDTTGSFGYGETSGEDGDIAASFTGKDYYKGLIRKANSVPITLIFSHYGLRIDVNNRKIICPFPSHKGGRESLASFLYYPYTNTYCCFGCRAGSTCCDFVSNMDSTSPINAAYKIIDIFGGKAADEEEINRQDFSERLEIMLDFSNTVREFRQDKFDKNSHAFIEEICRVFDDICLKHKLDNEALRIFVQKLKEKVNSYIPCLTP